MQQTPFLREADVALLKSLLPPDTLQDLLSVLIARGEYVPVVPLASDEAVLSTAERRVLDHLAIEPSITALAARLSVSPNTVKTQLRSLYRKLGARDRKGALIAAGRQGLIGIHTDEPA